MPYGRKRKYTSMRGARRPTAGRRRRMVKPPSKKRTQRSYVRRNAQAVNTLARKVARLQRSQYGSTQLNMVRSCRYRVQADEALYADNYILLNNNQGIAFDVRDFSKRTEIPGVPAPQYNYGGIIWQRSAFGGGAAPTAIAAGCWDNLMGETRFWTCNNDIVDGGKYLINYNKLQLQFRVMQYQAQTGQWVFPAAGTAFGPTYVDIRLISHKPEAIRKFSSSDNKGLMPKAIAELGFGLANQENAINPYYFKTWSHKRFVLDNTDLQTSLIKNVNMFLKPKGVNFQGKTLPDTPGEDVTETDPISGDPWGQFNVSYTQPLWLVISTSNPQPLAPIPDGTLTAAVRVVSTRSWRDINGSAML